MNVAVYGGSFNPFHKGHKAIIEHLISLEDIDKIYLMVSPVNPFKEGIEQASAEERLKAVQKIAEENNWNKVLVSDIELKMPAPHYTISTLRALQSMEPQNRFSLAIGADNLEAIRRWKDYNTLLTEFGIRVFPRKGVDCQKEMEELLKENPEYKIEIMDMPQIDISSTEIRNSLKEGKSKGKILVTGANGFLASNTIEEMLLQGYSVKGVLRRKDSYLGDAHNSLELIEGCFYDIGFIEEELKDCDYLVHIAADTNQNGKLEELMKINCEASVSLAKAAIKAGIRRMIYVSSANAFAYGNVENPGDETAPSRFPFTESAYAVSKAAAQKELLTIQSPMDIIIVNPTFMLGAMDQKPSSGRIIMMGYGEKLMVAPPGGKNFVHVRDVAKGIVAAVEKGENGEAYLLCNENISYKDFYRKLAAVSGKKTCLIELPKWALICVGAIGELLLKIGIKTELSLTNMRILCIDNYYTNAKAVQKLGVEFTDTETAIKDAVLWFKTNGMLD